MPDVLPGLIDVGADRAEIDTDYRVDSDMSPGIPHRTAVKARPMRIVSLLPSVTEMLFAIGAGGDVVGVTHECDFPAAARALPVLTSSLLPAELQTPPGGAVPAIGTATRIDRHVLTSD